MSWLQKVGAWLSGTAWPFLKKHWRAVALVAGGILAFFVVKKVEEAVVKAILGKTDRQDNFHILDPKHLSVQTPDGWVTVDLGTIHAGPMVRADNVKAVQIVPGGPARVEIFR